MQQRQDQTRLQRFKEYQASKAVLFWACAGSVILATVVGFSWGGWVTGGSAREMANAAAAGARQDMAAVVCVDRFMAAQDALAKLTALQEISSPYAQANFVVDGGWSTIVAASGGASGKASTDDRKAAVLCAAELAKREIPIAANAPPIDDATVMAQ